MGRQKCARSNAMQMIVLMLLAFSINAFVARGEPPHREEAYFENQRRTDVDPRLASLLIEWEKRAYTHVSDTTGPAARLERRILWATLRAERFNRSDAVYLVEEAQRYMSNTEGVDWEKLGLVFKCTTLGLCLPETHDFAGLAIDRIREEASDNTPSEVIECGRRALFVLSMSPNSDHWQLLSRAATPSFWGIADVDPGSRSTADPRHVLRETAIVAISGMPVDIAKPLLEELTKSMGSLGNPNQRLTPGERTSQDWNERIARMANRFLEKIAETKEYMESHANEALQN